MAKDLVSAFIKALFSLAKGFARGYRRASRQRKRAPAKSRRLSVPPPVQSLPAPQNYGSQADLEIRWTRILNPPERYRISYADRHGEYSERTIALAKLGEYNGAQYLGVFEDGKFKTLRADRVLTVSQVSAGHTTSIRRSPGRSEKLPSWPVEGAVHRVPSTAGKRHWTVDLNAYTCTCPEKRVRISYGYLPGMLGHVCPHMALAIIAHLPEGTDWDREIITYLKDPQMTSISQMI